MFKNTYMLNSVMKAVSGIIILNVTSLAFLFGLATLLVTSVVAYRAVTLVSISIDNILGFKDSFSTVVSIFTALIEKKSMYFNYYDEISLLSLL